MPTQCYPFGKVWQLAFDFIMSLQHDREEKTYPLQGCDFFAIIMSYEICSPEIFKMDVRSKYLDIQ
jgi:beta-galactosidase beta subunit